MRIKVLSNLILLILCALVCCACQRTEQQKAAQQIKKGPSSVLVLYDRNASLMEPGIVQETEQMLNQTGIDVITKDLTGKNQYKEAIEGAVQEGRSGIVIALQYDLKADEALDEALRQGVKVLNLCGGYYNSTISFSVNEYDTGYDTGRLVAEKLREQQDKPRITLITAKDLRNTERGFEDGLRELLPETVIRYKLISESNSEEMTPDFISSRYFSDAIVIFFCDNVKLPVFNQKPLVFYTGLSKNAVNADDKILLTEGDQLTDAVDQYLNALTGKRVDERGFYYDSSLN